MLIKASQAEDDDAGGDGGDDDDDYDEAYMKKHLKRYMKANKEEAKEYAQELGFLKKSFTDSVSALENVEEAEAVLVDGTGIFKAFTDLAGALVEKISDLKEEIADLRSNLEYQGELTKASGEVLIKSFETVEALAQAPAPRRGVTSVPQTVVTQSDSPLQKAKGMNYREIKRMVLKAAQEGNSEAAELVTSLDICGGNLRMLSPEDLKTIDSLV